MRHQMRTPAARAQGIKRQFFNPGVLQPASAGGGGGVAVEAQAAQRREHAPRQIPLAAK
jgi:hypothetical protein